RRVTQRLDRFVKVGAVHAERQLDLAVAGDFGDGSVQRAQKTHATIVAETNTITDGEPFRRSCNLAPAALIDTLVQIERDPRPGFATDPLAFQRSAYHAGVV